MIYTLQVSKNNTMQLLLNKNDWIFFKDKAYCLAFEPVNKSILELYLIPANKSRLSIVYNKLERICVNL